MSRAKRAARTRAMQRQRKLSRTIRRVLWSLENGVRALVALMQPLLDAMVAFGQALLDAIPPACDAPPEVARG